MKHRYMLWAGHLFVLIMLLQGLHWVAANIRSISEYALFLALAAMTGVVLNHSRWWVLSKKMNDEELLGKVDLLMLANYCILIFVLQLIGF
jgi:hypothetical protein